MTIHARVYWKGLRLGDFRKSPAEIAFVTDQVQFQSAVGGAIASAWAGGANARLKCDVEVAFRSGFNGSETSSTQFWNRIRNFVKDLKRVVQYGTGAPSVGPLCVIREGAEAVETVGALSAGSSVSITLSETVGWTMGQIVLIAQQSDPTIYEVATILSVGGGGASITVNLANSYAGISDVCRVEWYWPECAFDSEVRLPTSGPAPANFVQSVRISFAGVVDPVNGGLT